MMLGILFVGFLLSVSFANAVPRDAITYIEKYDPAHHEGFIRCATLGNFIPNLNDSQLPCVPKSSYENASWYLKPFVGLAAWWTGYQQQEIYVACENDEQVGFIRFLFKPSGVGVISHIAVSQEYQGYGHGTALLRKVLERARELKVTEVNSTLGLDHRRARALYGKMGFTVKKKTSMQRSVLEYTRVIDSK